MKIYLTLLRYPEKTILTTILEPIVRFLSSLNLDPNEQMKTSFTMFK